MRLGYLLAALVFVLVERGLVASQQPAVELFPVVQHELRVGASMGMVVERRDLRWSPPSATSRDDEPSLERLAAMSPDLEVRAAAVRRTRRRVVPRQVEEVLATPVRAADPTMTVGRAIFIVPSVAIHGAATGVVGGGVPSDACRLEREVQIDDRTRPLAEFLDDVVGQAPGIAWVLTWDAGSPATTLALGAMCADGSMSLLGLSVAQ
ncbi:MAG TPA: hypothetical protein VMF13_22310 [Luteitalea sp.]|nr:hypothetical protein [Luteitalea sp.]